MPMSHHGARLSAPLMALFESVIHFLVFLVNSISEVGRQPLFLFDIYRASVLMNEYK